MLHKDAKTPDDEWTERLRASVRRHRQWTWVGLFFTFFLFAIPIGLFLWWIFPEPPPPPLKVIAFDALGQVGENMVLRARLEPAKATTEPVELGRHELIFESGPLGKSTVLGEKVLTAAAGEGEFAWSRPDSSIRIIRARFPGDKKRNAIQDDARVFFWPTETPLFLVDAAALAAAEDSTWDKENILSIQPRPGAAKALQKAEVQKYRIVFLAPEIAGGPSYSKLAGWVKSRMKPQEFPQGPVLGGKTDMFNAVMQEVRQFSGAHLGVAANTELAKQMRVGCPVIFLGPNPPLPDMESANSWIEVPDKFPKTNK